MLNLAAIQGRLVRDPELRTTTNGKSVTNITLANEVHVADKTNFLDMVAWDKTAEFICRNFKKGQQMVIDGYIQSRDYEDRDGQKRHIQEIVVERVNFAGNPPDRDFQTDRNLQKEIQKEILEGDLPF